MKVRATRLVAVALALIAPAAVRAQLASSIEVRTHSAQRLSIAPSLRLDRPFAAMSARAAFGEIDGGGWTTDGSLAAVALTPSLYGFRASLDGSTERTTLAAGRRVSALTAGARLSYRAGRMGVWLGRDVSRDDQPTPLPAVPRVVLGGWRQIGDALVTFSLGSTGARTSPATSSVATRIRDSVYNDTTRSYNYFDRPGASADTVRAGSLHEWTDAETGLHWSRGRVALDGLFGVRIGVRQEERGTWGRVDGAIALSPRAAVVVGAGVVPARIAYGIPSARHVTLGVRLSPDVFSHRERPVAVRPVAAGFAVRPAGRGTYTLSVRVPQARIVELSGDFTRWQPVTLARGRGEEWEITLPLVPGTYRLNIRVDGDAWMAPPGTSTVRDEFNGTVGLLIVP